MERMSEREKRTARVVEREEKLPESEESAVKREINKRKRGRKKERAKIKVPAKPSKGPPLQD